MLEILYQDEYIIAINKPSGLLVHKSYYARDAKVFAVQELRNQIGGQHVYPIHRLDRKTSGVLLFALDKETLKIMNDRFATRDVEKKYLAILRGWAPQELTIDYDLTNDDPINSEQYQDYINEAPMFGSKDFNKLRDFIKKYINFIGYTICYFRL